MELTIEQSCPSCGAPIVLSEDDKLIVCTFCDAANYRIDTTTPRYTLPYKLPDDIHENELLFIPYLRFKGCVYFVEKDVVHHKIVDTTRIGVEINSLAPSLGLRPQVMKVWPVTKSMAGQFVLQTVPVKSAFLQATRLAELFSGSKSSSVLHRAFIGETISIIYQPFYLKDEKLVDAVDGRDVGGFDPFSVDTHKTTESKKNWEPVFIGTMCKKCGGLLTGKRDSCVLVCDNCATHWVLNKTVLNPLDWSVVEGPDVKNVYFPFWKISFSTTGVEIDDFQDLVDFTNQPIIAGRDTAKQQLYFLLPGFKLNPKMYLQIASQLTLAQKKLPESSAMSVAHSHPVNLDLNEAQQSIKSVLAHITVGKKNKLQYLPEITINIKKTELLYLPFTTLTHDYIQCHTHASIQVAAVRYGRSL